MAVYINRKNYPELAPISKEARKLVIKKVCDDPMRNTSPQQLVWLIGGLITTAAFLVLDSQSTLQIFGIWTPLYAAAVILGCTWFGGLIVQRVASRRAFLRWLDTRTDHGRPHNCIFCGALTAHPTLPRCAECDSEIHRFNYDKLGRPCPQEREPRPSSKTLESLPLPPQNERQEISAFLLNQKNEPGVVWSCLGELLAYAGTFVGIFIWLALWYWIGFWAAAVIIAVIGIAAACGAVWVMTQQPKWSRKKVRRYCPDGVVPWCVHCDYDLRGHVGKECPECGQAVFEFDPKRRWRRQRRAAPQEAS